MGVDRLGASFYRRDAVAVARGLLGQRLVRRSQGEVVAGIIVETEAYLGTSDKAAHSFGGRRTARNESMYAAGGVTYVFLNYGIHYLLNIVVAGTNDPQAVLLRAVEPTHGLDTMQRRRPKARQMTDLCSGPGKLGAAFDIDRRVDRIDVTTSDALFIEPLRNRPLPANAIVESSRIGVDYAEEWATAPLRFFIRGNIHVSRGDARFRSR